MRGRFGQKGGLPALATILTLGIAGCGGDDRDLASLVPPDAPFYAEVSLRPEGEQADAVQAFADRVAGIEDPAQAVIAELDASLAEDGVDATYEDDIEPWLGERAAVFMRSFEGVGDPDVAPGVAVLIDVEDEDAAQEFIDRAAEADPDGPGEERSYDGFDYRLTDDGTAVGLVEDALVLGPEVSFKVTVDADMGESLAASEEYTERVGELGDDLLASAYLEPGTAIQAAIANADLDPDSARMLRPLIGSLSDPVAVGLSATPEAAQLDFVSMLEGQEDIATDASLVAGLPEGSWLAVGVPDLGGALQRGLDQLANSGLPGGNSVRDAVREATGIDLGADRFDWLGDTSGFVRGTSPSGFAAGLIAETTDAEGPRKLLEGVEALAERRSGLRSAAPPEGAAYGFSLGLPEVGGGVQAGLVSGQLVAVVGGTVAEALDPESTLGDDPAYQAAAEALGDFPAGLYVHLPSFLDVAQLGGSGADPGFQAARPYLEAFESLAAGTRIHDELAVTRLAVSLGD